MKKLLFIILCFAATLQLAAQQGITKYGQNITAPSNDFVDKNGKTGNEPMLDANGQRLIDLSTSPTVNGLSASGATILGYIYASSTSLTDFGFCWGTSSNPVYNTAGFHISWNDQVGPPAIPAIPRGFSTLLSSLTDNTKYYFRFFAINASGVHYGNEETFTTLPVSALDANTFTPPSEPKIFIIK